MATAQPTILLVDDEASILSAIKRQLRSEGYRILTTEDPTQVLSMLGAEDVDVLVSDVNMPEMSGLELMAQARTGFPAVTRILLTGQTSIDVAVEAINRGEVFRYLPKPWAEGEICEAVRRAVQLAATQRRRLAVEDAAAGRAALLDRIEREHPGIFHVERSAGVYVLPDSPSTSGAVTIASPAIAVLDDLAREATPSLPGPVGPHSPPIRRSAPSLSGAPPGPARTTKRWEDTSSEPDGGTDQHPPAGEPSMESTTLPQALRVEPRIEPPTPRNAPASSPSGGGDLRQPRGGAAFRGGIVGAAAVALLAAMYAWAQRTPAPVAPPGTAPSAMPSIVPAAAPPLPGTGSAAAPAIAGLASAAPVAPTTTARPLGRLPPAVSTKMPAPAPSATSVRIGDLKVPDWR
jgi:FixJ family two-component response regulator